MTDVLDRVQQEFMEYCRRAYESGDRPVGRDASGWVARKSADFFSGKLDMRDPQNATMIAILREVATWDTGENAPHITVKRVEEPEQGTAVPMSEQIDPWADAGLVPPETAGGVEQVADDEIPPDLQ